MSQLQRVTGRATSIRTEDGYTKVRYHSTDVVTFNDKTIELYAGGWQTMTTKVRMNQASNQFDLGFTVYQKDFAWFVHFQGKTYEFDAYEPLTLKRVQRFAGILR